MKKRKNKEDTTEREKVRAANMGRTSKAECGKVHVHVDDKIRPS